MPSVIDIPAIVKHEEHAFYEEQPRVRPDRAGFWHTVVQYMRRHRVRGVRHTPSCPRAVHTCEAPIDLLARQYPTLYIQAYAGI